MKKFIISFLLSLVIFSTGFYVVEKNFLLKDDLDLGEIIKNERDNKEVFRPKKADKNTMQFVLMGIDDGGLKVKRGVRTDTLILFNIDFDSGKINGLTIPRDSRVPVGSNLDKINHAHSIGGPDMSMKTINSFLGTNLDYYLRIDFKGVMNIVDSIGGVDMNVPVNMHYDDPTAKPALHIRVKKGQQNLSGKMSHDVLRFRHNNGTDYYPGGYTREEVQQMWVKEFIKSSLSPKNILKLGEIIEAGLDSVDTNIPSKDIFAYALKAKNIDLEAIEIQTIPEEAPGHIINGAWYYLPDEFASRQMADEIFNKNK